MDSFITEKSHNKIIPLLIVTTKANNAYRS